MRRILFICALTLSLTTWITAQQPAQTPPPAPAATPIPERTPNQQELNRQMIYENQRRQSEMNRLEMMRAGGNTLPVSTTLRRDIENLYRKTSKKELKKLAVDQNEIKKYDAFLRQDNTGLIKLIVDTGCSKNPNILVVTEDCLKYSMPGGGSSYSFRVKDYRIPRLADLTFTANTFQATGKLLQGIMVGLGDIPLEKVNLQSPGMKVLTNFQPTTGYEEALKVEKELSKGMLRDGFAYSRALKAIDNMTYALRSIAYEGKLYRAVNGITYNELGFDKRKDVIVVFRIVDKDSDGNVVVLWKELLRQNSPEIKRKGKESEDELKKNNFTANNL